MTTRGRVLASVAALLAWGALALQFALSYRLSTAAGRGLGGALVDYFGYFTILSNLLVACALTAPLVAPTSRAGRFFSRPAVIAAITTTIALVMVAYELLLRGAWKPTGFQFVADVALHDVVPVVFVLYWWFAVPRQGHRWREIPRWWLVPGAYFVYALVRGAILSRYPYHFIDVTALGYGRVFLNALAILAGFTVIGLGIVGLDRLKGRRAVAGRPYRTSK